MHGLDSKIYAYCGNMTLIEPKITQLGEDVGFSYPWITEDDDLYEMIEFIWHFVLFILIFVVLINEKYLKPVHIKTNLINSEFLLFKIVT